LVQVQRTPESREGSFECSINPSIIFLRIDIARGNRSNRYSRAFPMFTTRQILLIILFHVTTQGFVPPALRQYYHRHVTFLFDNKENRNGYKFGDLTKSLLGTTANVLTGTKEEYKFGDITKGVVKKAADAVKEISGKDDYQFGDLTLALDRKAKEKTAEFTGKSDYQVGDISKEILRRVRAGECKVEDIILLVKIMATLGAEFSPLASMLPAKLLLEMMNYSLAQEVGGKVLEIVTGTLDKRFKEAVTGDADYAVGDLTKKAIFNFIGKKDGDYELGDLTRTISKRLKENDRSGAGVAMDAEFVKELEQWDAALNLNDVKQL
jgi:hypothetical protein